MRRFAAALPLIAAAAALLAPGSAVAAAVPGVGDWDRADQRAVAKAGLLAPLDDGAFHGERPLTGAQLAAARAALTLRAAPVPPPVAPVGDPSAPAPPQAPVVPPPPATSASATVSVAGFDRALVDQLGLADVAAAVQAEAARARLAPPARFGTEVVARMLGLRFNHPWPQGERLELFPWQAITRAEAAYSLARVAAFRGWEAESVRGALTTFALPAYGAAQRSALRIAISKIGMPYIWGGETDGPSWGQVHGGYDCSGFAWRVFKLSGLPAGRKIGGRTAAQQAGEIPRSKRIHLAGVQPGDLLFFGPGRFWQKATERRIVHEGIALSRDWAIHSSAQGVYVLPLGEGWLHDEFVWARRVL
jgi:cell wall-associated NlpC family hydrolase